MKSTSQREVFSQLTGALEKIISMSINETFTLATGL
jgi:hypothetical protein